LIGKWIIFKAIFEAIRLAKNVRVVNLSATIVLVSFSIILNNLNAQENAQEASTVQSTGTVYQKKARAKTAHQIGTSATRRLQVRTAKLVLPDMEHCRWGQPNAPDAGKTTGAHTWNRTLGVVGTRLCAPQGHTERSRLELKCVCCAHPDFTAFKKNQHVNLGSAPAERFTRPERRLAKYVRAQDQVNAASSIHVPLTPIFLKQDRVNASALDLPALLEHLQNSSCRLQHRATKKY